ncbi:L,D-transpeptidase [Streptomyces chilikensis]|uniref:L,D-transpeptidase n=2 Tax=Streptomyces TaxID=1883 RepID=UPI003B846B7E
MNVWPIAGTTSGRHRGARRTGAAALMASLLMVAVTACGGGGATESKGEGTGGGAATAAPAAKQSEAVLRISPEDGAESVKTSGALEVFAEKGKLTKVEVKDDEGTKIDGDISADGAAWIPSTHLASGAEYTVHAEAEDADGRVAVKDTSFTTLTPANTFIGHYSPEDGAKVGVGMPFSLRFTRGITEPDAVEKAIEIKTDPPVEVEGHWFGNDRLDFRPEEYWKAGTKVTVKLNLDGVEGRPGVYGSQAKTVTFEIGRRQVSTVDAKKLTMKVERDGEVVKTIPVTTGAPGSATWNGKMVISERYEVTRMNGDTVGYEGEYDIADVPHAMRLTDSGTFIHGNYWGGDAFGNYNASHGCVGLRDTRGGWDKKAPGAWFFDNSLIGDVVEVKNSADAVVAPGNGLNGWNMSWEEWKK